MTENEWKVEHKWKFEQELEKEIQRHNKAVRRINSIDFWIKTGLIVLILIVIFGPFIPFISWGLK